VLRFVLQAELARSPESPVQSQQVLRFVLPDQLLPDQLLHYDHQLLRFVLR
jgi:hypothetical protein